MFELVLICLDKSKEPFFSPVSKMHYGPEMKKHRINSYPIIHCPTSEGVSEVSEWANEWVQQSVWAKRGVQSKQTSRASKWGSGRASGPVLQSGFLVILDHSEMVHDVMQDLLEKLFQHWYRPTNQLTAPNLYFIEYSESKLVCIHFL